MADFKFKCFNCGKFSPFKITSENRGEVQRLRGGENEVAKVRFLCVNCGYANDIDLTTSQVAQLIARLASDEMGSGLTK